MQKNNRLLFWLSLIPAAWVLLMILSYEFRWDLVWLGALRELLTIPILLGCFILLVVSAINWIKEKFEITSFSLFAFLICLITLGSLFF